MQRIWKIETLRYIKHKKYYTEEKGYFINNLVNNAGFGDRTDFLEMDVDYQIQMTEVNCNAALYFTRKYLTKMVANDEGHIINVSSIAGFMPGPYMATYYATKSYVYQLTEAIYYEEKKKKKNVHISVLCPGPVDTEFNQVANVEFALPSSARLPLNVSALKSTTFAIIPVKDKSDLSSITIVAKVVSSSFFG